MFCLLHQRCNLHTKTMICRSSSYVVIVPSADSGSVSVAAPLQMSGTQQAAGAPALPTNSE